MTNPGPVERVPIKVVPYYVQPAAEEPEPSDDEIVADAEPAGPKRRTPWIGVGAVALAVAVGILTVVAISVATGGDLVAGMALGYAAIALSVLAFLAAVVAVIFGGAGRRWGVVGIVLALLANPFVLLVVLEFFERWQTGA